MSTRLSSFSYNSKMDASDSGDEVMDTDDEVPYSVSVEARDQPSGVNGWLGEKYLEFLLCREVAKLQSDRSPDSDLGSQLLQAQRCYPYSDHLQFLEDQSDSTPTPDTNNAGLADREVLLISIGHILLNGAKKDRKILGQSLCKFAREQIMRDVTPTSNLYHGSPLFEIQQRQGGVNSIDGVSKSRLAPFAVALKERGDQIGMPPEFSTTTIREYPPQFKTIVRFDGRVFKGVGSSKKQSRHEASKAACAGMGIEPEAIEV